MKLAIIAATGGVGQQLLRQALGAGHDVTAVVRNPAKLPAALGEARIVTADMGGPEPAALEASRITYHASRSAKRGSTSSTLAHSSYRPNEGIR